MSSFQISFHLAEGQPAVEAALAEMKSRQVVARLWAHDHTLWKPDPKEIVNRLGWLHIAEAMLDDLPHITELARSLRAEGYTHILLLGMGGSSLAPELFAQTFGGRAAGFPLAVLDTTDPGAVLDFAGRLDMRRTLFIVSTKSGGTVETLSAFKYFYNLVLAAPGDRSADEAGAHFVAITDPDSGLADLAARYHFRQTFLNDPNIGGRFSALSYFGLIPAALVGVDVRRLLQNATAMAAACGAHAPLEDNPALLLGATLGELAKAGRDKVTFILSPALARFGDWVEQLIAESTGKEGKGILPVVGEPPGPPALYGPDRLFVSLELAGDESTDLADLQAAGHPAVRLRLDDLYDLGGQFFLWEMATALAGHRLGVNPFDQPDVEAAKQLARRAVADYRQSGLLPLDTPAPLTPAALLEFLAQAKPGDYIALHAYLRPTPESDAALTALRLALRDRYRLATTVGYGPRFLHSTGQLHKGDAGRGWFIQFTADDPRDAPIPDEAGRPESSITFGVLKMAQALGDRQALLEAGRRVIHFHLGRAGSDGLYHLASGLG